MGVGRALPSLWAALTVLAAAVGTPVPWVASGLALLAALVGLRVRQDTFAAGLLVVGAAPIWTASAVAPDGGKGSGLLAGVLALGAAGLLWLARPALPRALPWALLGAGAVLGSRQLAASLALPEALPTALGMALAGLTLAGLCAGARRGRAQSAGLALAGLIGLTRAGLALQAPPEDASDVAEAHALGVLRVHEAALALDPELARMALAVDPVGHGLALRLLPRAGADALLDLGWRPERAPLDPALRLSLAERLDARGEGGRAARVLRAGRADPEVAWALELQLRRLGRGGSWTGAAPPDVPVLPGEMPLFWGFFTNGERLLDLHAAKDLAGLRLELVGTSYEGAPRVLIGVDDRAPERVTVEGKPTWVSFDVPLRAGPHRLRVVFDEDRAGPGGDRNVWVMGIASP